MYEYEISLVYLSGFDTRSLFVFSSKLMTFSLSFS